jgi:hypothetical protein
MKARLATLIGWKIWIHFPSKESICISDLLTDEQLEEQWNKKHSTAWDEQKAAHPNMLAMGPQAVYDTPSGNLEPGCLYWHFNYTEGGKGSQWDNDEQKHLIAVCPDGFHWDIDSRASNCTMKHDRTHRCWIRHGEPPNVTVDKNGHSCNAGAGSIQTPKWHGYLQVGEFKV